MNQPWLTIIGIGEDGIDGLSVAARDCLGRAQHVFGGHRHIALAAPIICGRATAWPVPMTGAFPSLLAGRGHPTVVLASGDPSCYGIAPMLQALVDATEITCVPAASTFSLACARLQWALHDTATISFCGRPLAAIMRLLQPGARIIALSEGSQTPAALAALLTRHGFGPSVLHVMEALGGSAERIRTTAAADFDLGGISALNAVAIEVSGAGAAIPLAAGRPDTLYQHDGQLTRREIRAVTLSTLAPRQGELLWDVGGGAGSVGIEWMLCHPLNRAIAIEPDAVRADRIRANADRMGTPGLQVVHGAAPDAYAGLNAPDAVFLGGGAHRMGVIEGAWAALPTGGRIVANAVTIETESALLTAQRLLGGSLLRLSLARLGDVGGMHAFRPAMTVTQWEAIKP